MRTVSFCLASVLTLVMGSASVRAVENRLGADMVRDTKMSIGLDGNGVRTTTGTVAGTNGLPKQYASAMTWYRTALEDGYTQPPLVASPWLRDEQLPEPLQWTWVSDNGDLVTRAGKGVFRLSFADNENNWFQDVDCRLLAWPGGDTEAPMSCEDGVERTMAIPGDGVVLVDDVQYVRVFDSDATTLPPEEVIDVDELTAAAIQGAGVSAKTTASSQAASHDAGQAAAIAEPSLPSSAPIPRQRQASAESPAKQPIAKKTSVPAKKQELPAGLY